MGTGAMSRRAVIAVTAMVMWGAATTPAVAEDPAGCLGNRFEMDIFKDRTYIRDGETVNYFVSVRNDSRNGCTVSSANVMLQLPSPTGGPDPVFQPPLTNNATFPVPTAE